MPPLVTPTYTQTLLTLSVGASTPFFIFDPLFLGGGDISTTLGDGGGISTTLGDEQIMITSSSLQQDTKMWHNYFPLYLLPW